MLLKLADFLHKNDILGKPYRGIVMENVDPDKIGRVKVSIPGLVTGATADLPWAFVEMDAGLGGRGDSSSFAAPEVGSEVVIEFPYKDIYFPVVKGFWQTSPNHQRIMDEDYPYTYGFRDLQGTQLKINKAKKFIEFLHTSGMKFFIDSSSFTEVMSSDRIKLRSEDDKTVIEMNMQTGEISLTGRDKIITKTIDREEDAVKFKGTYGGYEVTVSGASKTKILGGKSEVVGGSRSQSVLGNSGETVAGDHAGLYTGDYKDTFGSDVKRTLVEGDQTELLMKGNYSQTLTEGNHSTILTKGDRSSTLTKGGDSTTLDDGNYNVLVKKGDVSVKTEDGKLLIQAKYSKIEIDASGKITMDASAAMDIISAAKLTLKGTAGTDVGDPGAVTQIQGSQVLLAGGGPPVARLGDMTIGTGNLGAPVISTIIQGSPKVLAG